MKNINLMNIPLLMGTLLRKLCLFLAKSLFNKNINPTSGARAVSGWSLLLLVGLLFGGEGMNDLNAQCAMPNADGSITIEFPAVTGCTDGTASSITVDVQNSLGTSLFTLTIPAGNTSSTYNIPATSLVAGATYDIVITEAATAVCFTGAGATFDDIVNTPIDIVGTVTTEVTNETCDGDADGQIELIFTDAGRYDITYVDADSPPNTVTVTTATLTGGDSHMITGLDSDNSPFLVSIVRVDPAGNLCDSDPISLGTIDVLLDADIPAIQLYEECLGEIMDGDTITLPLIAALNFDVDAQECDGTTPHPIITSTGTSGGLAVTTYDVNENTISGDGSGAYTDATFTPSGLGTYTLSVEATNSANTEDSTITFTLLVGELNDPIWTPDVADIDQPSCATTGLIRVDYDNLMPQPLNTCGDPYDYHYYVDLLKPDGTSAGGDFPQASFDISTNAGSLDHTVLVTENGTYTVILVAKQGGGTGVVISDTVRIPIVIQNADNMAPMLTAAIASATGSNGGTNLADGAALTDGIMIMDDGDNTTAGALNIASGMTATAGSGTIDVLFTVDDLYDNGGIVPDCDIELNFLGTLPSGISFTLSGAFNATTDENGTSTAALNYTIDNGLGAFVNAGGTPITDPTTFTTQLAIGSIPTGVYPIQFEARDQAGNADTLTIVLKVGEPTLLIEDACTCNNDATQNQAGTGTFSETLTLESASGEDWRIVGMNPMGSIRGANNTPFAVSSSSAKFTETPATSGSMYEFDITHTDGIGYTAVVQLFDAGGNPIPGTELTIENKCSYPNPTIPTSVTDMCVDGPVISLPSTGTYTLNGISVTSIIPSNLTAGTYNLVYTETGTRATNFDPDTGACPPGMTCMAGCTESISTTFNVIGVGVSVSKIDASCNANDGQIQVTEILAGIPNSSTTSITYTLTSGSTTVGPQTSNNFPGLAPGTYTAMINVTVDGTTLCTGTESGIIISQDADNTPPSINCNNFTIEAGSTTDIVIANLVTSVSDACDANVSNSVTLSSPTTLAGIQACSNIGANSVTLDVVDASANSASCTVTVTVTDNTAPSITCQAATVALTANGTVSITGADVLAAGAMDACGIKDTLLSTSIFDCSQVGTTVTVTVTVSDVNGNVSTCPAMVTIDPPSASVNTFVYAPAPFVNDTLKINATSGDCTDVANWQEPNPADYIGVCAPFEINTIIRNFISGPDTDVFDGFPAMVNGQTVTAQFPLDTTVFEYRFANATDTQSVELVVIVTDTEEPIAACPTSGTIVLSTNTSNCQTALPDYRMLSQNANCGNVSVVQSPMAGTLYDNGQVDSVTIMVTNPSNPSMNTSCKFEIRVDHSVIALDSVSLYTPTTACASIELLAPTAKDNCDNLIYAIPGTPINVLSVSSGSASPPSYIFTGATGATGTINWLFFGTNSSATQQQQIIFSDDTVEPMAMCLPTMSISVDSFGMVVFDPMDIDNGSTDMCTPDSITLSTDIASVPCDSLGKTFDLKLYVEDAAGNIDSCISEVTIIDAIAPVFFGVPANDTIDCSAAIPAMPTLTAVENCGMVASMKDTLISTRIDTATTTYPNPTTNPAYYNYTITYEWIAEDTTGNRDTARQVIVVEDNVGPVINYPDTMIVPAMGTACVGSAVLDLGASVTDNCSDSLKLLQYSTTPAFATATTINIADSNNVVTIDTIVGDITVYIKAIDFSDNETIDTLNIMVMDQGAPIASCATSVSVSIGASGSLILVPADIDQNSRDACSTPTLTVSRDSFACADIGQTYPIVLTATDAAGNAASCTSMVTIQQGNTAPCGSGGGGNNTSCVGFNITSITSTAVTATGANDGTATVVGGGASGAYNYQWVLGNLIVGNTATIAGLAPGTYSVTVTDQSNANCMMSQTVVVQDAAVTPPTGPRPVQFILCPVAGAPGTTVQVPVKVVGFDNVTSFAMSYNIASTADAQFVTPNPIGSPAFTSISSGPNTSSRVNVIWVNPTGQTLADSSVVFTISMVLGANNATVPITIGGSGNATALEVAGVVNGNSTFLTSTAVNNNVTVGTGGTVNPPVGNIAIRGRITVEDLRGVEGANVNITGGASTSTSTNATGDYGVTATANTSYTIMPFEDDNHINGVNLGDMIRIARHIAHIDYLDSPLQLIAADVNRDGRVNSRDRSEIFQIVLGKESRFDNNTSWRFIPKTHVFPASAMPPTGQPGVSYPESITVNSGTAGMSNLDFWAVKIGDVDSMAIVPFRNTPIASSRSNEKIAFNVQDQVIKAGTRIAVPFKANDFTALSGYQMTIDGSAALSLVEVEAGALNVSMSNFYQNERQANQLSTVWYTPEARTIADDETLFTLYFDVQEDGQLIDLLSINSEFIEALAIDAQDNHLDIGIEFEAADLPVVEAVSGNFELYQNRPNPFRNTTTIGFNLPTSETATLRIFDLAGRQLHKVTQVYQKGYNEVLVNSSQWTSGVLYYELETATQVARQKMILIE